MINISYVTDISTWIEKCRGLMESKRPSESPHKENSDNIIFALNEYKNVLKMFDPKKGHRKMPDFLQKIDEFISANESKQDDLYNVMAESYKCFEKHASKRLINALKKEFRDIEIMPGDYGDELEKAVTNWIKKTGNKKQMGRCKTITEIRT